METLFIILVFLAIWHFVYEGIISPYLRHGLRYKFFALRDRLRQLKINGLKGSSDTYAYKILDGTICSIISEMSFISIGNYFLIKRQHRNDKEFHREHDLASKVTDNVSNDELRVIDKQLGRLSSKALLINNGSLALYLFFPIIIFAVLLYVFQIGKSLNKSFNEKKKKISSSLIYSRERLNNNHNGVPLTA